MSKETMLNEALKQINCIKAFQTCRSIFRIKDPQLIGTGWKSTPVIESFWKNFKQKRIIYIYIYTSLFIALLSNCSVCLATSAKLLNFCNSVTPSQVERANSEHFLRNVEQLHWKQLRTDVLIPSPKSWDWTHSLK